MLLRLPEELQVNLCKWCIEGERCDCGRMKPSTAPKCEYCERIERKAQRKEPQPTTICSYCGKSTDRYLTQPTPDGSATFCDQCSAVVLNLQHRARAAHGAGLTNWPMGVADSYVVIMTTDAYQPRHSKREGVAWIAELLKPLGVRLAPINGLDSYGDMRSQDVARWIIQGNRWTCSDGSSSGGLAQRCTIAA
jgi:hypothetical protein